MLKKNKDFIKYEGAVVVMFLILLRRKHEIVAVSPDSEHTAGIISSSIIS